MSEDLFRDLYASDREDLERLIRVEYEFEPDPKYKAEQAAARLLLITTRRTIEPSWYDPEPSQQHLGTILNLPRYGPGQSPAKVELALPLHIARPEEGLSHLLMILTSPVEYEYTKKLWVRQVRLPEWYLKGLGGPRFGVNGIREAAGVTNRPLLGLVVRPRTGVSVKRLAQVTSSALAGGVDFLVDDLLMGNPAGVMSFRNRVPHFVDVCERASTSTARKLYFANLSGTPRTMFDDAVWAAESGVGGLVVDPFVTGFGALQDLTDLLAESGRPVPVLATNMGSGIASRVPTTPEEPPASQAGLDEAVIARLSRLAGADGVHVGTTQSECYHVEWGDAVQVLSASFGSGAPRFQESFRIAEGDLQLENIWRNIHELGHSQQQRSQSRRDVMLEVTNGILNFKDEHGRPDPEEGARVFLEVINAVWAVRSEPEANAALLELGEKNPAIRRALLERNAV